MAFIRKRGGSSSGGMLLPTLGGLVAAVVLIWAAIISFESVDGELLTPIPEGLWEGLPTLLLVLACGLPGLAFAAVVIAVAGNAVWDALNKRGSAN